MKNVVAAALLCGMAFLAGCAVASGPEEVASGSSAALRTSVSADKHPEGAVARQQFIAVNAQISVNGAAIAVPEPDNGPGDPVEQKATTPSSGNGNGSFNGPHDPPGGPVQNQRAQIAP